MITTDQLRLAINDRINNDDINPSHVPLALLGEFQNLLSFEDHKPVYDEKEFKLMVERGTKAWSGVPVSWLEDLRGNNV